jgi:hypothetical protein
MAEVEAKAPEDKVADVPAPESAVEETAGKFTACLSASFFPHSFGANGGNVALLKMPKYTCRERFSWLPCVFLLRSVSRRKEVYCRKSGRY